MQKPESNGAGYRDMKQGETAIFSDTTNLSTSYLTDPYRVPLTSSTNLQRSLVRVFQDCGWSRQIQTSSLLLIRYRRLRAIDAASKISELSFVLITLQSTM